MQIHVRRPEESRTVGGSELLVWVHMAGGTNGKSEQASPAPRGRVASRSATLAVCTRAADGMPCGFLEP